MRPTRLTAARIESPWLVRRVLVSPFLSVSWRVAVRTAIFLPLILWWAAARAGTIVVDPSGGGDAVTFQQGVDLQRTHFLNGREDTVVVLPHYYAETVVLTPPCGAIVCPGGSEVTSLESLTTAAGGLGQASLHLEGLDVVQLSLIHI